MRKGVVAVVALLAAAGIAAAGYVGAKRYGENRLRDTMNTLIAGSATVANLQYGAVDFDPLARRATIDDIVFAWQGADLKIGRTILNDIDFGKVDPQHARIEFRDVTDRGFFNALLLWITQSAGPRSEIRYDLL